MQVSSKVYNILKFISTKGIYALVVFLGVIGDTLELPWMIKVTAIISGLGVALGILLGISSTDYWKDKEIVAKKEDSTNGIQ